jgi:4,5:9,10-diseco-3-hydroxy-5,9,17-trioxoandrosta-1(10),2-diene-4-oate hydrolase
MTTLTRENTSRFVQAGQVRIHYHEAGTGPVLLCLHGGAPGAFGWGNFGRNLPAWSQHFRTLIVDLPGYGLSDKPGITGARTGFYARTFIDMLDALNIERAHVLGMATGGTAALKMAIDHPERIDRLVVINAPGGLSVFQTAPPTPATHNLYTGEGPSRERIRAALERSVYNHDLITDDVVEERYAAATDPAFMTQAPEGKGGPPGGTIEALWKDVDRIRAETLIVWGREHATLGMDQAMFLLSRIPRARLHIHGQCKLWVPFEKAEEFNRDLVNFLTLPA